MNIGIITELKEHYNLFKKDHPTTTAYIKNVASKIKEGTTIEIRVTSPEGKMESQKYTLTKNDVELIAALKTLK